MSAMKWLLVMINLLWMGNLVAQQNKQKAVSASPPAPLTYVSSWGPVGSGSALAAQIAAIAPAAVLVKDNRGESYIVNAFRINYKFRSSYKDDETEQVKFMNDLRVSDFNNTSQLSTVWAESIKDNVKAGDTILINKILFKNKTGKLQLAPDIRIAVK
jgi:predicted nicotinamide N-methyase